LELALTTRPDFIKDSALFRPRVLGIFSPCAPFAKFLARFFGSGVSAAVTIMSVSKMLDRGDALKIFRSIIALNAVYVVDLLGRIKIWKPTSRHNAVHKSTPTQNQIPLVVLIRRVRLHLSKNFSAARNSIKMIVDTVFNTVHRKANHVVVILSMVAGISSYYRHKEMSNGQ